MRGEAKPMRRNKQDTCQKKSAKVASPTYTESRMLIPQSSTIHNGSEKQMQGAFCI